MSAKGPALARIAVAYVVALGVAVAVGVFAPEAWFGDTTSLSRSLAMDLAATVAVFAFSLAWRNSSVYDAYWSVAPIALAAFWAGVHASEYDTASFIRAGAVLALVFWWGWRLTYSWARGWTGFDHEDWRYVDLRKQTGPAWQLVNLLGIHVFPTIQVFLGLLPVHAALCTTGVPLGVWDALAVLVTGGAILLEQTADRQLHEYRLSKPKKGSVLNTGVWAYSRHPNYLGEIGFWLGLCGFSLAVGAELWRLSGAAAITLMFMFVSIPMIEKRSRERRPGYEERAARGILFPRPKRNPR